MKLEFHPEAEREFIEAAVHYEFLVPGLGVRFSDEVRQGAELLLDHPEIGSPVDPDLRRFVLGRFPFSLIYAAVPETIRILAIAHQRRRPGYWRSRTAP